MNSKIRTYILLTFFLLILHSSNVFCFGWFEVTGSYIENLGQDWYRLNVSIDWGGETLAWNEVLPWGEPNVFASPALHRFELSPLLGSEIEDYSWDIPEPYNFMLAPDRIVWSTENFYGGIDSKEFGYTFKSVEPLISPVEVHYDGFLCWSFPVYDSWGETFTGTTQAQVIPEPSALVLIAIGFCSLGVVRNNFRKSH